jgi:hypothetical protein
MIPDSIYKALKPDELTKIECCRYCQKKFTFLSEHLAHMKAHTQDVESVSQMSINIWIQVIVESFYLNLVSVRIHHSLEGTTSLGFMVFLCLFVAALKEILNYWKG